MPRFFILLISVWTTAFPADFSALVGSDTLDLFIGEKAVGQLISTISSTNAGYAVSEDVGAGRPDEPGFMAISSLTRYDAHGMLDGARQSMKGSGGDAIWELTKENGAWALSMTVAGNRRMLSLETPRGSLRQTAMIEAAVRTKNIRVGMLWADTVFELTSGRNLAQTTTCTGLPSAENPVYSFSITIAGDEKPCRMEVDTLGRTVMQEIPPVFTARKARASVAIAKGTDLVSVLGEACAVHADRLPAKNETVIVSFGDRKEPHPTVVGNYRKSAAGWSVVQASARCAVDSRDIDTVWRAPSMAIQSHDPSIIALADSVCAGVSDPCEIISRLTFHVYRRLDKRNTPVFSNALETLRAGYGDCGEHAALLAALLRARGIGARVVNGLVFIDGMGYRYHAWVEVYSAGPSLYADAALGRFPAHEGYIPLFVDNDGRNLVDQSQMVGRIGVSYAKTGK